MIKQEKQLKEQFNQFKQLSTPIEANSRMIKLVRIHQKHGQDND